MNNKGFAKFEVLTILVLIAVIISFLLNAILKMATNQKLNLMVTDAKNFSRNVIVESDKRVYYLRDAIKDELYDNIRSPFSTSNCDVDESKIEIRNNQKYVTLKCDEYLIYDEESSNDNFNIYTVSDWLSSKNSDKMVGYDCEKDGKKVFNKYFEEDNFLSHINELYNKEYNSLQDITECSVLQETLFRDLKLVR